MGLELLPLLLGTAAVVGVGFLVYKASTSAPVVANTTPVVPGTPPDQLAADLKAGTAAFSSVVDALKSDSSNAASGSVYTTLNDGTTIFNDGSGGFTDSNGNTLSADQVGNALLMS